jgi:hypothetical protein
MSEQKTVPLSIFLGGFFLVASFAVVGLRTIAEAIVSYFSPSPHGIPQKEIPMALGAGVVVILIAVEIYLNISKRKIV